MLSLKKENTAGGYRCLLIFCTNTCLRKPLPEINDGKWLLTLECEDTGLMSEVQIMLTTSRGYWQMDGKVLSDRCPFYFYTKEKEELLLLLSEGMDTLKPSGKILLRNDESIKIGNAYTNQIFYECFSLMSAIHAQIICRENEKFIINTGQEGIYVNEKVLKGQKALYAGDRIDIYGLHLLVLREFIICVSFCGICRIAESRNLPVNTDAVRSAAEIQESFVERNCEKERALHTGKVEIIMPDKPSVGQTQPLFLSIGPMVTMIFPMLFMALFGSRYMEGMGSGFYYTSVVMSVCTAFLAVFWALVNRGYNGYCRRREKRERQRQYRDYLKGIEKYLTECQEENRLILEQRYPSLEKMYQEENGAVMVLWNRYYRQKDFLFIRLGIGEVDFQMQITRSGEKGEIQQGELAREAVELEKRFVTLTQAVVGVDLYENRQIGLIEQTGGREECVPKSNIKEVLLQILMQIVACHCYTEVKIVCFYRKERTMDREIAECLKWVPHCWSSDRKMRFLAGSDKEASEIIPFLARELVKGGSDEKKTITIPWYVVVVLDEELIAGEAFYQYLTETRAGCPVSTIFAGMLRETLPKSCRYFLMGKGRDGEVLKLGSDQVVREHLLLDTCSLSKAQKYVRKITGLKIRELKEDGLLPERIDFLQLYGCRRVEELESERRWQMARPEERIKAVIGCRAGGNLISLDVHEKFHGPHGLVAGTTGSGKSELLQTYLLSLAVSYSPADVNFFVIDYKGGGTGNFLKGLPHCAGVISNLSGKQIKRAMSAIASENKRRQKLLGEYRVNHIDVYSRLYREGKAVSPMPHLILVVDEFAELKKQEPEFMQEIISLAQVGRSLGMHLILATQKPAGTVDDKIWSNARFRLCLKVQDKQDSMDMLKNGDAAALTVPGQCYMQIGNQEYYELFQAGYCGGSYRENVNENVRAVLLSDTGRRKERKPIEDTSKARSQIQVLMDYINQVAEDNHYTAASSLWLPELPEKIVVKELRGQAQTEVEIVLGLCDDPENQRQFPFLYQPLLQGHLAVCGGPGSGKTTFLQTVLWQLCNEYQPWQVQVLIISMGQEGLLSFLNMPGCLGVLKEKRDEEVFLYHLEKLVKKRREQLAGISCYQYNQCGSDRLPYVFLVIDNYGSLGKELDEGQEEFILKLASEGISLGIYLILSATSINEIGSRIFEKIKVTAALELSDRYQYGDVLRQHYLPVFPEENKKGRGLCKADGNVLEFQGALAVGEMEDYKRIDLIKQAGRLKTGEWESEKMQLPSKFPVLPKKPVFHTLAKAYKWQDIKLPVGYCFATGEIQAVSPREAVCFLISGNDRTGRTNFLSCMIEGFLLLGGQAVIIDKGRRLKFFSDKTGITYLKDEEEVENWRKKISLPNENKAGLVGIFISDMGSFCHFLDQSGEMREERKAFWEQMAGGKKENFFLVGIYNPARDVYTAGNEFFREFIAWQWGICLGGNVAANRVFNFDDLNYTLQNRYEPPGTGYLKKGVGSATKKILLPVYEQEGKI